MHQIFTTVSPLSASPCSDTKEDTKLKRGRSAGSQLSTKPAEKQSNETALLTTQSPPIESEREMMEGVSVRLGDWLQSRAAERQLQATVIELDKAWAGHETRF